MITNLFIELKDDDGTAIGRIEFTKNAILYYPYKAKEAKLEITQRQLIQMFDRRIKQKKKYA